MSNRENRKTHHKEREKQYRSIVKAYEEVAYKKYRPQLIELDKPRFAGYERYYDVADEYIGTVYEHRIRPILDKYQNTVIRNTKNFIEKRRGGKKELFPTFYGNRSIWELPKESLSMLNIFMTSRLDRDTWSRYLVDRYHIVFINPKFLKLKIRKYYITHVHEDQPEVKRAYDHYIGLMYGDFIDHNNANYRSTSPKWYRKNEQKKARRSNNQKLSKVSLTEDNDFNFDLPKRNWW